MILAFSCEFRKGSLKLLELNVITRHYAVTNIKFMRFLGKNKSDYLYANFKNVLTIRYHFSYIGFSCTMLYCIQVFRVLLKLFIYHESTPNLLIPFGLVVQMVLVAGFLGNAIKIFGNHWHVSCYCSVWTTIFTPEFSECFQKSLFSSGLTYL